MPEHEPQRFDSCDVCERTILRGERMFDYLTPDREHRSVCALCRERAKAGGWIRADSAAARAHPTAPRRRRGLRAAKLRERLARAGERVAQASERVRRPRAPAAEHQTEPRAPAHAPASAPEPEPPRPESPPAPELDTAARRLRHAVATFNEAEQARVVAGLIRSLGEPQAAVLDRSRKPPRAEITVAWELSWYRWQVLLDSGEVRELAKGAELAELEDGEPDWNATVDGEGKLHWPESSS